MSHRIIPIRDRFRRRKRLVLFICTGNTCRSPMATGYFRHLLTERGMKDVEVRSAGVMTITGLLASQEAVQVMAAEEIDIGRHRSTQLTPELIRKADVILAMTPFHQQSAIHLSPEARYKTFLLKEFTRSDLKNVQIADPMGCTLEVFKKCFKEVRAACTLLVEHDYINARTEVPRPMSAEQAAALKSDAKRKASRQPAKAKSADTPKAEKPKAAKPKTETPKPTQAKAAKPAKKQVSAKVKQVTKAAPRSTSKPPAKKKAAAKKTAEAARRSTSAKKKPAKATAANRRPANVRKTAPAGKKATARKPIARKAALARGGAGKKRSAEKGAKKAAKKAVKSVAKAAKKVVKKATKAVKRTAKRGGRKK